MGRKRAKVMGESPMQLRWKTSSHLGKWSDDHKAGQPKADDELGTIFDLCHTDAIPSVGTSSLSVSVRLALT